MPGYNLFFKNAKGKISPIGVVSKTSPVINTCIPYLGNIRISSDILEIMGKKLDDFEIVDFKNNSLIDNDKANWRSVTVMRISFKDAKDDTKKGAKIGTFYKKASSEPYIPFRVIKKDAKG